MTDTTQQGNELVKEIEPSKNVRQLTFGVALREHAANLSTQIHNQAQRGLLGDKGVLGTILLLPNAATVWIGWGSVNNVDAEIVGTGLPHRMGPMVVAFPRTYGGEASCSSLVGGENEEDLVLATSMALRLTTKLGIPIYVSCALQSWQEEDWMAGLDRAQVIQLAAASAEFKIRDLIRSARQIPSL
mmetsp:Transcript_20552/g.30483  ORF Transcript_20552/g.30483 Transcript_20552/m.30483 type:complete len:187 (+) Transcript_20552:133-693(+)|eukprot:CAMPEP_0194245986 /NCGR_PEP_ID=MMETSP0158-20130606/14227_1 /TAXON_ID=33649 /ORGANISM="Thalassionema nitzschioides, Strain L26-B" /LENGTH=186 /DNA_ID=CAMNT_0038981793 /DNA_START=133 /DNA_END=693 /DNA_ORIENTATION=+